MVSQYRQADNRSLAGIPTIVYGVFALIAIGPFFAAAGELLGIQVRATSALTAGVVMGLMIIPFVSSLSDDIITRVPQSLRDGSLGLGATRSETIRQVVLPAALPGIVGAFLLAFSRAIGETMIVVLAAGNSPQLHANPLEAISTVTVSIVNQLTGDTDFAGPQSLVAFALGLTLFVITLVLNVIAPMWCANTGSTMTNSSTLSTGLSAREMVQARMAKTLRRRHRRERNFRLAGLTSVCVALACVLLLFGSILNRGLPAFWQSTIELPLYFDPQIIKVDPAPQPLADESLHSSASVSWPGAGSWHASTGNVCWLIQCSGSTRKKKSICATRVRFLPAPPSTKYASCLPPTRNCWGKPPMCACWPMPTWMSGCAAILIAPCRTTSSSSPPKPVSWLIA